MESRPLGDWPQGRPVNPYTEDNLVQKTTAEYLVGALGWDGCVNAMQEVFGAEGTLGRTDEG